MDAASLASAAPRFASVLPYLLVALSLFFIVGQSINSFDLEVHMHMNLLVTEISYETTPKEYSIITGVYRLLMPDDNGNCFPALGLLLFAWSGVWPHLKLAWLYWTFTREMTHERRSGVLALLGALGKFSLLDVFLVVLIVSCLQFNRLGNDASWAAANAREGVYVFCCAVLLSQAISTYIVGLHSTQRLEAIGSTGAVSQLALDDKAGAPPNKAAASSEERPRSLVAHHQRYWLVPAGAALAFVLFIPATLCTAYTLTTSLQLAPIADSSETVQYSMWTSVLRCATSPRNTAGHSLLALLVMLCAGVLPFVHVALVGALALLPLTREQLLRMLGRVEAIAEWAALDVFFLALIPVCLELGYMASSIADGKVQNEPSAEPLTMVLGVVACTLQHASHLLFVQGCTEREREGEAVEESQQLLGGPVAGDDVSKHAGEISALEAKKEQVVCASG